MLTDVLKVENNICYWKPTNNWFLIRKLDRRNTGGAVWSHTTMTFPSSGLKCQEWEVEGLYRIWGTKIEWREPIRNKKSPEEDCFERGYLVFRTEETFINTHYFQPITLSEPLMGSCSLCSWERTLMKQEQTCQCGVPWCQERNKDPMLRSVCSAKN
jgi:hypothetical protein